MHTLFEQSTADEIISRLNSIQSSAIPKWGKMNAAQMMAHCQGPFLVYFGEMKMKRPLISFVFGKIAKKKLFANRPWPRNLPTAKEFRIVDARNFEIEKSVLIGLVRRFSDEGYTITASGHPFFGKMSSQEWGLFTYRHLDHHLQQFGG
ncbi:MAG TPA: DUF1569 domain-containing protein, partial [Flavisolibacter sp.]|nr:DUF1569 domain-containing protein [Flavisolibacter sp.]